MRFTGWGGEDVDLASQAPAGRPRCGWPGAHATVLHLWHTERKGRTSSNRQLVEETESSSRVEAVEGLRELALELADDRIEAAE